MLFSYGRLVVGDTIADPLRSWLVRQAVQVGPRLLVLPMSAVGLAHFDEVLCITGGRALMLDWNAGVARCAVGDAAEPLPGKMLKGTVDGNAVYAATYGELHDELTR